jgi:hypothetical protein
MKLSWRLSPEARVLLPWGIIVLLLLCLVGAGVLVRQARYDTRLAEANYRASQDVVRMYRGTIAATGDSMHSLSILVEQRKLELGMLHDSLTGLETALEDREATHLKVVTGFTATIDTLTREKLALERDLVTLGRDSVAYRVVHIEHTDSASAILVDLYASVPLDTLQPAEIEYATISVPPLKLGYALACSKDHDAVLALQGPSWATLTVDAKTVDPEVCLGARPSLAVTLFKPNLGKFLWFGAGAVTGYLLRGGGPEANLYVTPQRTYPLVEIHW